MFSDVVVSNQMSVSLAIYESPPCRVKQYGLKKIAQILNLSLAIRDFLNPEVVHLANILNFSQLQNSDVSYRVLCLCFERERTGPKVNALP